MNEIQSPVNIESRKNLDLRSGDRVRVWQKIQEKGKIRFQPFEGLVLARKHGNEAGASFTVRKISEGVGVERVYPLYSPNIDRIEILKRSNVRRSKIYYMRNKVAKEIRRKLRRIKDINTSTESEQKLADDLLQKQEEDKKIEEEKNAEAEKAEVSNKDAKDESNVEEAETESIEEITEVNEEGNAEADQKEETPVAEEKEGEEEKTEDKK